jgi:hypothetical protein
MSQISATSEVRLIKTPEGLEPLAYTVPTAAKMLGVSSQQLWRAIWRDEVPSVWIGRRRIILKDDLHSFLENSKQRLAK